MSRLVTFAASGPFELKPQQRSVWLCQCGLSQNRPFCDGSHAIAQKEQAGTLCIYNPVTQRKICELPASTDLEALLKQAGPPSESQF
jgi:CDGSH-type Zn-finger protein